MSLGPDIQIVPNYCPNTNRVINEKPLETAICKELEIIDNNIVCYIIILLVMVIFHAVTIWFLIKY